MDQIVKIRVSADDKAAFETQAESNGLSLSAWSRMVLKRAVPSPSLKEGDIVSGVGIQTGVYRVVDGVGYIDPKGLTITDPKALKELKTRKPASSLAKLKDRTPEEIADTHRRAAKKGSKK